MEHWTWETAAELAESDTARRLRERFGPPSDGGALRLDGDGLSLVSGERTLRGDFARMLPRLRPGRLGGELLVKAARIKHAEGPLTAVDATAGLGEDSLLLAAAGFQVTLFERNPVIFELLRDALDRAAATPELADIAARMTVRNEDSAEAMGRLETAPDVILLDPMFPERQKSALVKKKLQVIQKLEVPCEDERGLLRAAMLAGPRKLIVKRPPRGPYLAGVKPDHSIAGKAVRFDCFAAPKDRADRLLP